MQVKIFVIVLAALICVVKSQGKPGQCVPQITQQRCGDNCRRDSQCPGDTKCCSTTCGGKICHAPMTTTTTSTTRRPQYTVPPSNSRGKPGTCPGPLAQFSCASECQGDDRCPRDQKCCPTVCGGSMCKPPVAATTTTTTRRPPGARPGQCPSPAPRSNNGRNGRQDPPCRSECHNDRDCRTRSHKCCVNSCGANECVAPVN